MVNKTQQNNNKVVAESEKVQDFIVVLLIFLAVSILIFSYVSFKFLNDKKLIIKNQEFKIKIVDTPKTREKGLSGRERLGQNQGMLFKYTDSGVYCMWMKDMKYDIDIIWLDENKKVIDIKQNAEVSSYPEVFCPKSDSRYVLELENGSTNRFNIKLGDQATF